jgi:dihydroneopterin aldolase
MNQQPTQASQSLSNAARGLRHVFVNRLAVNARIGIHPHERAAPQTIWVSLDAAVAEGEGGPNNIADVVCYEAMSRQVDAIIAQGHIDLVETLAESIADALLADTRIRQLRVQIEKPDAIAAAQSVGIAIERLQRG